MFSACMAVMTCCAVVLTAFIVRRERLEIECRRYWLARQRMLDRREAEKAEKGFE